MTSFDDPELDQRNKCKLSLARQLAIFNGYNWQRYPNATSFKIQSRYLTLAENMLATVERMQADFRWP